MSETTPPNLDEFLNNQIAPRFADFVKAAEQRLATAQRDLEDLRAATGTMAWEIAAEPPLMRYINIAEGKMTVAEQPAGDPLMTIVQTPEDWSRFTGGMAALFGGDTRRPMGKMRLDRVRSINGALRFVLTAIPGGGDWSCTVYFGSAARQEPRVTISILSDTLNQIQAGKLDPQLAFMQGHVKIAGDMGFAMQLGMALFM